MDQKIKLAPQKPGVYLMKSADGKIIYIGKARNLKNRLKSYFQKTNALSSRIQLLISRISDFQWIVTSTELEALMLECTLIKKHHPRYNVHLRDDKTYPYLRITVQETWPKLDIVRKPKRDEAAYFGPYTSAYSIRETLKLLTKIFPIRDCSKTKFSNRKRPCISYDIGICSAPCVNYISEEAYRKLVNDLISFLEGKNKKIIPELKNKMKELSEQLKYEEAAQLRDRIHATQMLLEKQKVVKTNVVDQDVIGMVKTDHHIELALLFVRGGRLLGKKAFAFSGVAQEDQEFLSSFINQYYEQEFLPSELILPLPFPEQKVMEHFLSERSNKKVNLIFPKSGEKKALLEMAIQNAKEALRGKNIDQKGPQVLEELRKKLGLKNEADRIECYDISNIQGTAAVGSRVVFVNGEADKNLYRRYKIRTVEGPNDYAMMKEVLLRRFKHKDEDTVPDLLMIDGGKGQLSIALEVLKELEIEGVDVIALAKEKTISSASRHSRESGNPSLTEKLEDRVYLPGQKNPIVFRENSPILHLLQRVRDEAHRFAISYHKKLREKNFLP